MKLWYIVYLWLAIIKFCETTKNVSNINDYFRLPKTIVPINYSMRILSIMAENNFTQISSVKIQIHCDQPTNIITLHSRKLEIKSVKLIDAASSEMLQIKNHRLETEYDFLHIHLNAPLMKTGLYSLEIDYTGEIRVAMAGYYRSSYNDESGKKRWIATTHFEPTNARRAFPCFDEPALRAQFTIELGHLPHFTALSNMPLKSTKEDKSGWVWDTFQESLNMPTYLVAFTINDFGFKKTLKSNRYGNTTIKVWAPKKSLKQVRFATKIAPLLLSYFEEYFDIAYPLPKSDLLAVPDFASSAMENWGLITFTESSVLYVPGESTEGDKQEIADTIAHEIAHYWFGNLVTIKWWTYLWLKEGFATYLARVAVGHLFPEWDNYFHSVVIGEMESVFGVDAQQTSRPVSVPIHDPNTIDEIYDTITYSKGSCVIRMMEFFLGDDVLKKGLTYYLNKFKYNSTEPDNLWNSLTKVAHKEKSLSKNITVNKIMDTWISQPGFPLVTVVRDYTNGTVTVTQRRYLQNMEKYDDSCYWVPLSYTTSDEKNFNSTKPKMWLPCPKQNITFKLENSKSWILFNVQASGLYRVNYDKTNWKMLINELETNHQTIDNLNRVLLIDDVVQLAMNGYLDFKIAFDLVRYVRHDEQYNSWFKALGKLSLILAYLDHTSHYGLIQTFIRNLVIPEFKKFDDINKLKVFSDFQTLIINKACSLGNQDCKQQTTDMFIHWKRNRGNYTIPEDIRSLVYCQGMKSGDEKEWDYLWQHYLKSNVATEKQSILGALACTEKQWLLVRYLKWIIKKDSAIRPHDASSVFEAVIENDAGYYIARSFFYENVKEFYEIQSPKGSGMKRYLINIAASLKTEREYNEYKVFLKENKKYFKKARLTIKRTLEILDVWKHWYDNIYPKVVQALEQVLQNTKKCSSSLRRRTSHHTHK